MNENINYFRFLEQRDEDEDDLYIPLSKKRKNSSLYSTLPISDATGRVIRMYAKKYNKTTIQFLEDILYDNIIELIEIEREEDNAK